MTETQLAAAGLLGRGKSQNAVCKILGVSISTLKRWNHLPDFQAERARVAEASRTPDPEGVLLDALCATRGDGVDWTSRLNAAKQLLNLRADDPAAPDDGAEPTPPTIVYVPQPR